ncbi:MAG: hypothetical protein LC687_04160 [Actinobacteria bacterium]|nr:hypothetical protein [Actinomycetota bacterium]
MTRRTSNDLHALLELPGNILIDYYRQVEQELIEENKEKKRQQEKRESQRQQEASRQRARAKSHQLRNKNTRR